MNEENKALLDALIKETLEFCNKNPKDDAAIDRLNVLCQLATEDYAQAAKAYSDQVKADAEAQKVEEELAIRREEIESEEEIRRQELETEQAKLELDEKKFKFDRIFKPIKIVASVAVPVALIHADRIGEYVNKAAVTMSERFFSHGE